MNIIYEQILVSLGYAVKYIPVTLMITFIPLIFCVILGVIIALLRIFRIIIISDILDVLIGILKGIPTVLFLVTISLIFSIKFDETAGALNLSVRAKDIDTIYLAIFIMTVTHIASISESFRGAFISVPKGQYEAGYSVGLTGYQTFMRIIFPQAFCVLIPSLTNNTIGLLKGSSLVYMLGVMDILNASLKPANATYCFLEAYIAAAIIYWGLCLIIEYTGRAAENYFGKFRGVTV